MKPQKKVECFFLDSYSMLLSAGYQRAFLLKEFGCNPGEYVQYPVPIYLFQPIITMQFRKALMLLHCRSRNICCSAENRSRKKIFPRQLNRYGMLKRNTILRLPDMHGIHQIRVFSLNCTVNAGILNWCR